MGFQDILYAVESGIGVITLNRPQYRNAQSWRMLEEIGAAFDLAVKGKRGERFGLAKAPA